MITLPHPDGIPEGGRNIFYGVFHMRFHPFLLDFYPSLFDFYPMMLFFSVVYEPLPAPSGHKRPHCGDHKSPFACSPFFYCQVCFALSAKMGCSDMN